MSPEIIFTATNIAQFFLAIIAIGLSVMFFISAKNSEKEAAKTLEAIKSQTDILKDITSKQMSRLIKNVTEQKPLEDMLTIITSVRNLPDNNNELQLKQQEIEQLTNTAIEGYIGAYYYSAVTNFWVQINLPHINQFNPEDPGHSLIKSLVDISHRDFNNLKALLEKVDPVRLQNNPVYSYYLSAKEEWAPRVKDSTSYFASVSREG